MRSRVDPTKFTFPIILVLVGALLGILALLPQVPTPWGPIGPISTRLRWIAGVVGILLAAVAVYVYAHREQPYAPISQNSQSVLPPTSSASPAVDPERLIQIIKEKQHDRVGDSVGTLAYQCFTVPRLAEFKQTRIPSQVAEDLKKDASFVDLVLA